jgi:hypothetical protein
MQTTLFLRWSGAYDIHVACHEVKTKMLLVRWSRNLAERPALSATSAKSLIALPLNPWCLYPLSLPSSPAELYVQMR